MENVKYLYLNTRDELFRVNITKIVYFEADGNYTKFVMCNGQEGVVCMNLNKIKTILGERLEDMVGLFARIGKKHIINLTYVFQIAILRQRLVLSDGSSFSYQLALSKEALRSLRDLYINALGKKQNDKDKQIKTE